MHIGCQQTFVKNYEANVLMILLYQKTWAVYFRKAFILLRFAFSAVVRIRKKSLLRSRRIPRKRL